MNIRVAVTVKVNGKKVRRVCHVNVEVSESALRSLCEKAAKNKTGRSTSGPARAVVVKRSIVEAPVEAWEPTS